MKRLFEFVRAMGDLVMPRACLACGCRLGMHERHLCLACAADVPYTHHWLQPHNPMADRFNEVLERHRGTERMDYAYAVALMHYKANYRAIPRALKYHGNLAAGHHFGSMLGRHIASAPHFADIDLIIPVPLHWTRLRTRGYNQAEVLARAIASSIYATCRTDLLVRTRRTRTQTRLSVEQKARNVASAFRVPERFPFWKRLFIAWQAWFDKRWPTKVGHDEHRPSLQDEGQPVGVCHDEKRHTWLDTSRHSRRMVSLSNQDRESPATVLASARHILLVDDTFTTGSTLYACYAALRPYTSARISIATLAAVEGTPSGGP